MKKLNLKNISVTLGIGASVIAGVAAVSGNLSSIIKSAKEAGVFFKNKQQSIEFSMQTDDDFVSLATANGYVIYDPPFLRVDFRNIVLRANRDVEIQSIRVGLSHLLKPDPGWEPLFWSEYQEINKTFKESESVTIAPYSALIPIDKKRPNVWWLTMEIRIKDENPYGYTTTYGHSNAFEFN
jgi:hypothetical protein